MTEKAVAMGETLRPCRTRQVASRYRFGLPAGREKQSSPSLEINRRCQPAAAVRGLKQLCRLISLCRQSLRLMQTEAEFLELPAPYGGGRGGVRC